MNIVFIGIGIDAVLVMSTEWASLSSFDLQSYDETKKVTSPSQDQGRNQCHTQGQHSQIVLDLKREEERIGVMMERSFMGVSLSHLTSLLAFLVGMVSPFPAVDYLCGYMGVCYCIFYFSCFLVNSSKFRVFGVHFYFYFLADFNIYLSY